MADVLPKYGDMLRGVGEQLAARKGLIIKRMLLAYWPILLTAGIVAIFTTLFSSDADQQEMLSKLLSQPGVLVAAALWVVFMVIYVSVMTVIYSLEKLIWIDAHFDKKSLSPEQSWRVARRLALSYLGIQLLVLTVYVFIPFAAAVAIGMWIAFAMGIRDLLELFASMITPVAGVYAALLVAYLAFYYWFAAMPIRLCGFLYLDQCGSGFSIHSFLRDLHGLSRAKLGGSLGRVLAADFGAAGINTVVSMTTGAIQSGVGAILPQALPTARFVGGVTRSVSREMTSFGQLAAYYLVYRALRKLQTGTEQHINQHVYSLAS